MTPAAGRGLGVVLDAGAFIAMENRDRTMARLAQRFVEERVPLVTSAAVVAQIWRGGGARQIPVVYLLRHTTVADLTHRVARSIGRILGAARTRDPVDAHVVLLARERSWPVLTSDPDDLRRIDPTLRIEVV